MPLVWYLYELVQGDNLCNNYAQFFLNDGKGEFKEPVTPGLPVTGGKTLSIEATAITDSTSAALSSTSGKFRTTTISVPSGGRTYTSSFSSAD